MTGEQFVQLYNNKAVRRAVQRVAFRVTKNLEDREEYIQDAWLRLSEADAGLSTEEYAREAYRAITAARIRRKREAGVYTKRPENVHGTSDGTAPKRAPKSAVALGRGRYILRQPEKLSSWYYDGEWAEYGVKKEGMQVRTFYEIVVIDQTE